MTAAPIVEPTGTDTKPAPLSEILGRAETCANEATALAWLLERDEATTTRATQAIAFAEISRAWSDLAVARMRAGDRLDEEPVDPREQLRRRAGRQ